MSKKRYTLYLSRPLARKFENVARQRQGAKSALFEEAMRANLEPEPQPGLEESLTRRLNEVSKAAKTTQRDVAIVTETLALFVRYFLTITPPLPQSEQEPARLLGRERFQVFVAQVGRRLATDRGLVSEVLEASESPARRRSASSASLPRTCAARCTTRRRSCRPSCRRRASGSRASCRRSRPRRASRSASRPT